MIIKANIVLFIFCTTLPCATRSGEYYILIVFIFFIECIPVLGFLVSRTSWYRLYRTHHMHRSQRIHACIDYITWHRSHDMLDFVTVWHPPGIENSIFRTPRCFDTGGHRCYGLHIRCQSDEHRHRRTCCIAMSNSSSSFLVPTLFDTGASPTSFVNRHVVAWIKLQLR